MFIEEFLFELNAFLDSPITENDYDIIFMLEQLSYDYIEKFNKENKEIGQIITMEFAPFCRNIRYDGDYKFYRENLRKIYYKIKDLL